MSEVKPLVAIHCLVYNHEPYLRDCFEGFVMQQTNFRFVAIVHDDASTDGSAAIIREYEAKYPHIFKPIYEDTNLYLRGGYGAINEVMNAAIHAIGVKYVAMCEGDDYWTDPLKLQKQVDFMEANPECGLCYTDYNRLADATQTWTEAMFEKQNQYRPISYEQHLLKPGYLAPMTWLYRRDLTNLLSKAKIYTDGTYAYMLEFLYNSKVVYIPQATAVYRSHAGSASSPIGDKALFRYTIGVFRTQIHYTQKYSCSEELKHKVLMRGYLSKLPIAIMAENEDFVRETKMFMEAQDMDIDLIIRELKQGEMKRKSYAYRLGKKLLKPISWLRNKRK
jgi:glycosyltransferase involved in cell wall biosynthesis